MKILIMTQAYNEADNLPIWIQYYSKQVGPENLLILDHGTDDGSTADIGKCGRLTLPRANYDQLVRSNFVADLQRAFLRHWDAVIFTDCDEILIPDPNKYTGLVDYVSRMEVPVVRAVGLDVFQDLKSEAPLNPANTILSQRKNVWFRSVMCKPIVTKAPVKWSPGFHHCNLDAQIDPELYLIHLKNRDLQTAIRRLQITRSLKWSEAAIQANRGAHLRWTEQEVINNFFMEPAAIAEKFGPLEFGFDEELERFKHRQTKKGPWYEGQSFNGRVFRIPERLFSLV